MVSVEFLPDLVKLVLVLSLVPDKELAVSVAIGSVLMAPMLPPPILPVRGKIIWCR